MRKIKVGDVVTFDENKARSFLKQESYIHLNRVGFKGTVDAVSIDGCKFTIGGYVRALPYWCLIEEKIDYDNLSEIEE